LFGEQINALSKTPFLEVSYEISMLIQLSNFEFPFNRCLPYNYNLITTHIFTTRAPHTWYAMMGGVSALSDLMSSLLMTSRGRGDYLSVSFFSKFDETSLSGATVSLLMPI
jgi:hypothetical protein